MSMLQSIAIFISVALMSMAATGMVLKYLRKKAILDHPNERSSHTIPTPRGGGIGLLIAVLPALFLVQYNATNPLNGYLPVLICALGLAGLSWIDDLKNLGPAVRFMAQIGCVVICLYTLPTPEQGFLGGFLPDIVERIILGLGWLWFINLFNFMDGIDGISGVEIMAISLGLSLIAFATPLGEEYIQTGLIFGAGALGFLRWNWHKAKVFMGDVGSIPMGFLLGWVLILLAGEGHAIAAFILALYYLADATLTLFKRLLRKEKIWQAHREHYYQKATQSGMAHDAVVVKIALLNCLLIFFAWLSVVYDQWIALLLSIVSVIFCLVHFARNPDSKELK